MSGWRPGLATLSTASLVSCASGSRTGPGASARRIRSGRGRTRTGRRAMPRSPSCSQRPGADAVVLERRARAALELARALLSTPTCRASTNGLVLKRCAWVGIDQLITCLRAELPELETPNCGGFIPTSAPVGMTACTGPSATVCDHQAELATTFRRPSGYRTTADAPSGAQPTRAGAPSDCVRRAQSGQAGDRRADPVAARRHRRILLVVRSAPVLGLTVGRWVVQLRRFPYVHIRGHRDGYRLGQVCAYSF